MCVCYFEEKMPKLVWLCTVAGKIRLTWKWILEYQGEEDWGPALMDHLSSWK